MTLPIYGFLEGDTMGLLLLADENDTATVLVAKMQSAASVRVRPRTAMHVVHNGHVLAPEVTMKGAGIAPLDRIDVVSGKGD